MGIEVEDEAELVSGKLEKLLDDAGQACVGLDGQQVMQLLGGLAAQIEATLLHSMPQEHTAQVIAYLCAARSSAIDSPLMTLAAIKTAEA